MWEINSSCDNGLTLELLLILFTTNTWIIIKKLIHDIVMYIKQQIIKLNGRYQTT